MPYILYALAGKINALNLHFSHHATCKYYVGSGGEKYYSKFDNGNLELTISMHELRSPYVFNSQADQKRTLIRHGVNGGICELHKL